MLEPAIMHKDTILTKFSREVYSERYWWYTGWGLCHELPNLDPRDDHFQWAILNESKEVIGYFAYRVDLATNSVDNFGLYSFEDNESIVQRARVLGKDISDKIDELVSTYHRVSWRMISGNPVKRSYDNLMLKYKGNGYFTNVVQLHDITKDPQGEYHDEFIYEVIQKSL